MVFSRCKRHLVSLARIVQELKTRTHADLDFSHLQTIPAQGEHTVERLSQNVDNVKYLCVRLLAQEMRRWSSMLGYILPPPVQLGDSLPRAVPRPYRDVGLVRVVEMANRNAGELRWYMA